MKRNLLAILLASALMPLTLPGQNAPQLPPPPVMPQRLIHPPGMPGAANQSAQSEIRFNLDFHGGSPSDLVAAIDKARAKPINAIVPDDCNDIQIPPLKMTDVTVQDLFKALQMASIKYVLNTYNNGLNYSQNEVSYGFETTSNPGADNSVWYFKERKPTEPLPTKEVCRFYNLESLLEKYKIEDITTAIQSGWQMLHVTKMPQLKFHPETRLLIAVGPEENLQIIENVLRQLEPNPLSLPRPLPPRPLPSPGIAK